jgi:hypothetical protein
LNRWASAGLVTLLLLAFIAPSQLVFADKPQAQTYTLGMTVNGYWNPDPGYQCPPRCEANTRISGSGVLSYSADGQTTTVKVKVNGTVHADWTGVGLENPCAPMSAEIQVNTAQHDKLHLQVDGSECMIFVSGQYIHKNAISATYSISSGAGLFQDASGDGSIAIKTIPSAHTYSASVSGTLTFTDNGQGAVGGSTTTTTSTTSTSSSGDGHHGKSPN